MLANYLASSLAYSKCSIHVTFYDMASSIDEILCKTPEISRWGPCLQEAYSLEENWSSC